MNDSARYRMPSWKLVAFAAALAVVAGCKSNQGPEPIVLSGAGSTFVYPVMGRWTEDFQQSNRNVQINYQSIGSGGGIQQVRAGTVDFGASDAPLSDQELTTMPPVIQIPESAGPVCVTYNLAGLDKPLRLSPEALAGIFLGKIKNWQDAVLKRDNPGESLPNESITVVHRADGSGTTNAFTTYLSQISKDWSSKVGQGKSVSWPVGLGGKGSEGVTGQIKQSPGAIGYVELTYATQNKLPVAAIQNQGGSYILPSTASTTAAIAAFGDALAKDLRSPIANPPANAQDAYPISTLTFLIIPKDGPDTQRRTALKQFVQYVVSEGQSVAGELNYAPLPDAVKQKNLQLIGEMTAKGAPIR